MNENKYPKPKINYWHIYTVDNEKENNCFVSKRLGHLDTALIRHNNYPKIDKKTRMALMHWLKTLHREN